MKKGFDWVQIIAFATSIVWTQGSAGSFKPGCRTEGNECGGALGDCCYADPPIYCCRHTGSHLSRPACTDRKWMKCQQHNYDCSFGARRPKPPDPDLDRCTTPTNPTAMPQSTVELPSGPATPPPLQPPPTLATPAIPATPANPATPATPRMPATPATPRMPATPATPRMPATPATPRMPATPRIPATPSAPPVPSVEKMDKSSTRHTLTKTEPSTIAPDPGSHKKCKRKSSKKLQV